MCKCVGVHVYMCVSVHVCVCAGMCVRACMYSGNDADGPRSLFEGTLGSHRGHLLCGLCVILLFSSIMLHGALGKCLGSGSTGYKIKSAPS